MRFGHSLSRRDERVPSSRWLGVTAAVVGAIGAIWWMPYYPVWSWVYMAIGGLVIYALVVYGGRSETVQTAWRDVMANGIRRSPSPQGAGP